MIFLFYQEIISLQPGFISSRLLCKCWNIIASHISSEPSSLTTEISKITPTEDLRNSSNTLAIAKCLLICITEQTFTIDLEDRKEIFGGIQQAVEVRSKNVPNESIKNRNYFLLTITYWNNIQLVS